MSIPLPRTALFVFHDNFWRSPYAAAVAPSVPSAAVGVESAGFVAAIGESPEDAVSLALERRIDLSSHRSQLIELQRLRDADLVFVMDRQPLRRLHEALAGPKDKVLLLGNFDPSAFDARAIPDSVGPPLDTYRSSMTASIAVPTTSRSACARVARRVVA